MNRKGKLTIVFAALALLFSGAVYAGNLDQPLAPSNPATAMYTLEDIYNRLLNGTTATKRVGPFAEPGAGPAATGHTLDDVYNLIGNRAFVPKTGQTGCWDGSGTSIGCGGTGQDGEYQKGVDTSPNPRFTDNSDGTVTDNLTGLIWLKDAGCMGQRLWGASANQTFDVISRLNTGENFSCTDYTAGTYNDWRLPNLRELQSLIDYGVTTSVKLPSGHFFANVKSDVYWSATTCAGSAISAWYAALGDGFVYDVNKANAFYSFT